MWLGELALQVEEEPGDLFFKGVTINGAAPAAVASEDGAVTFTGCYSPVSLSANDKSKLFMGAGDKFHYPNDDMTIGAFRAYLQLAPRLVNENLGDVNGDSQVSVSDVMAMVDYVMGNGNGNILQENADINGDGAISVSDVMELVNMVIEGHENQFKLVVNTGDGTATDDSIGGDTGPARAQESTIWDSGKQQ